MSGTVSVRRLLYCSVVVTVLIIWVALDWREGTFGFNFDTLSAVGLAVTVNWSLWGIFKKYLWHSFLFKGWLVKVPDLSGKWKGKVYSEWKNPKTGQGVPPIDITATIQHRLDRITVDCKTGEIKSTSDAAVVTFDSHRKEIKLKYNYTTLGDPQFHELNKMNRGAAELELVNSGKRRKLEGVYFTDAPSKGTLKLTKIRV